MNAFELEASKSCKLLGIYYQKVAVAQRGKVKLKSSPYDSFILAQGRFIAVELKSQKTFGSFPLSNIQDHQIAGLQEVVDLGCSSYLLLNQRRIVVEGKSKSRNRAWALDFSRWSDLLSALGSRKSIPVDLFEQGDLLMEIPRVKYRVGDSGVLVWDLRMLTDETPHNYISPDPWHRNPSAVLRP